MNKLGDVMYDCCDNPIIEDIVETITSRNCFETRNAIYLGNGYYKKRCANCGAGASSEYMTNAVQYDFDPKLKYKGTPKKGLKWSVYDE
jgi:predicted transcriptional regulator